MVNKLTLHVICCYQSGMLRREFIQFFDAARSSREIQGTDSQFQRDLDRNPLCKVRYLILDISLGIMILVHQEGCNGLDDDGSMIF